VSSDEVWVGISWTIFTSVKFTFTEPPTIEFAKETRKLQKSKAGWQQFILELFRLKNYKCLSVMGPG
jgi:hypothetical protein